LTSVVAALAGEQIVKFCCTAWLHHSSAPCRLHKSLAHANLLTIATNNSTETKSNQMQTERRVVVATQVFLSFLGLDASENKTMIKKRVTGRHQPPH
jgi:hypothetical protein